MHGCDTHAKIYFEQCYLYPCDTRAILYLEDILFCFVFTVSQLVVALITWWGNSVGVTVSNRKM